MILTHSIEIEMSALRQHSPLYLIFKPLKSLQHLEIKIVWWMVEIGTLYHISHNLR